MPDEITTLIVDDHEVVREGLRLSLSRAPHIRIVGEAADGASAIEAATTLRPDVVLIDVYLPDIDGFEVAAALTNGGQQSAIVMTSSRDARDFGPLVAESGARGFIPKAELSGTTLSALLE